MTPKHLCLLLIALVAINTVAAQNEDELQIPEENDNQFPPDKQSDMIDGSGDGVIEEPGEIHEITTEAAPVPIEHIQTKVLLDEIGVNAPEGDDLCPKPCVCRIEGDDFIVDCSGYNLSEFPTPINEKATILYLQKNALTEIPKEISSLKSLKILNANDNNIKDLAPGSVSELPALTTLKLRNNRLIDYPKDLKNSIGLTKLEEIDLGGNDMRTDLTSELFSKYEALRMIVLPTSGSEFPQDLCEALPNKLEKVCIQSCENQQHDCADDGEGIEDELPVIPGMIPLPDDEDNLDPAVNTPTEPTDIDEKSKTSSDEPPAEANQKPSTVEFSFRSAVNKQPNDVSLHNSIVEAPKDVSTPEPPVKVGATTSDGKSGGVDKSVIGLVVAGMIVIVAGITIKKNWSSITKRFSSNSRTPIERNGTNANGTAPEEVPLQDKSPV